MKHQVHTRMTEGGVFRSLLLYSLPLIAGNLMQQLYNTFDSIIVGNLVGNRALAAVGASGQIIYLLVTLCVGASTGAGILIATYYGAEDERQTGVAVHTALVLSAFRQAAREEGRTVLLVSHEEDARGYADAAWRMDGGVMNALA